MQGPSGSVELDLEGDLMPSENKGSESEAKESRDEKDADETEKYRRSASWTTQLTRCICGMTE